MLDSTQSNHLETNFVSKSIVTAD